ncbi:SRPBCC domain-containing protein [Chloroflexi bacterium TSY]|nr:SRPBCC domain-containing protein [Chloroflexi bacterium TSY]
MHEKIPTNGRATLTQSAFRKEFGVAINIEASPAQVWSRLTDAADIPRWTSTVSSVEGRIAKGEKIALTVPYAPGRTFNLTVQECVPQKKLVWGDDMAPMFKGIRTYTLTEKSDGSTDFSMVEVLTGVMLPLIGRSLPDFGPPFEQYAADLKRVAEVSNGH